MPSGKPWVILIFGLAIFSIQVSTVLGQEAPIHIVDGNSSVSPNPASLNQSIQLKICVRNLIESEVSCSIRISAVENLSIYPSGELNVTALGKGHGYDYPSYANTYFYFTVIPNKTGAYPITVELWYGGEQLDFYSTNLQVWEGKLSVDVSYEGRVGLTFFIAFFTIGIVYMKVFNEEGKLGDDAFWVLLIFYTCCLITVILLMYAGGGFSKILSQSIGRIELILAITFIFCFASLILMKGRSDASLKLVNIVIFLITLPIILDWLYVPNIPSPDTLLGKIVWQLVEIAIATIIGSFISIIFKQKSNNVP